ncbi:MAG: NYN domain-containing protein [Sphingomonadales bacterium]|nr:NYN domain-containing protein [Sphingomonadales bacterium]
MIFYPNDRTALFIDGANLYATARSLDLELDYKRVRESFAARSSLIRAYYYTAIVEEHDYSPLRPLIDWLDYNGYTIVTKPAKEFTDDHGRRKVKGNMDIEIAVDMLTIADSIDHVILLSGDGDFRRLIEAVQRKGVRTTVISTTQTSPPMIADELRRQADQFVDLLDIQDLVCRVARDTEEQRAEADDSGEDGFYEEDYEYEETT